MFIKKIEVDRIINSKKNMEVAKSMKIEDTVDSIRIFFNMQSRWYTIHSIINYTGYENRTILKVNEQGDIIDYDCSCPFCSEDSACGHIGMIGYYFTNHDVNEDFKYIRQVENPAIRARQNFLLKRQREMIENKKKETRSLIESYKQEQMIELYDNIVSYDYHIYCHGEYIKYDSFYYQDNVFNIDFKLGKDRMYIIRNIGEFIYHIDHRDNVVYGKKLQFIHTLNSFDEASRDIINFIKDSIYVYNDLSYNNQKYITVSDENLDNFFECFSGLGKEYCNFNFEEFDYKIPLNLSENNEYYILKLEDDFDNYNFKLSFKNLYAFNDDLIGRVKLDDDGKCISLIKSLLDESMFIDKDDFASFYKYILNEIEDYIVLTGELPTNFEQEESISLYGDIDDNDDVVFQLEYYYSDYMRYGFNEDNHNLSKDADLVEAFIKHYASDISNNNIYIDDDEKLQDFMSNGLPYLSKYCQIFVTDALHSINHPKATSFTVGVNISNNLLEIDLDSIDISKDEIYQVLSSYRKKRKFHRLKNGELINLNSNEIFKLDQLADTLHLTSNDFKEEKIKMPIYRLFEYEAFSKNDNLLTYNRDDSINEFLNKFNDKHIKFDIDPHYNSILRDYQKEGYQWLKLIAYYGFGGILADDMGLGKTLQMIAYLDSEKDDERVNMDITPASLLLNWEEEIEKFSTDLKSLPIYGSKSERREAISKMNNYDVVITSYDYLRRDIDLYDDKDFYTIVLDEAQYIKNHKTLNARCVKKLNGKHRFALTGTPIENSLAELWSIFDFLMPNYLYNYHYFSERYEKPIVLLNDEETQNRLLSLVSPFLLRRNKSIVLKELPPKIEKTLTFTFNDEEKNIYYSNLATINKELRSKVGLEENKRIKLLAMLTKLRQLCLDPRLVYDNIEEPSSKIKGCIELLHSLKENNKKVLLFSSFTSVLDLLKVSLKEEHISFYTLSGANTKEQRKDLVQRFQNDNTDVFLISLKAGGTGLNLTAAEAVIHFDPWWNISAQNQATDRAYRIGQNKSVQVFQLIMKDSIEEKIQNLQAMKKELSDTFVENGNSSIGNMSMDEIVELFKED